MPLPDAMVTAAEQAWLAHGGRADEATDLILTAAFAWLRSKAPEAYRLRRDLERAAADAWSHSSGKVAWRRVVDAMLAVLAEEG